jgi:hypothetical protein
VLAITAIADAAAFADTADRRWIARLTAEASDGECVLGVTAGSRDHTGRETERHALHAGVPRHVDAPLTLGLSPGPTHADYMRGPTPGATIERVWVMRLRGSGLG